MKRRQETRHIFEFPLVIEDREVKDGQPRS